MADLRPFRGLYYNSTMVSPGEVVCSSPRYMTAALAEAFRLKHTRNTVRLLEPRSAESPETALEEWRREGVLVRDADPSFYVISQTFRNSQGTAVQRFGLVALCKLREFSAGDIIPHQRTIPSLLEESVRRLQRLNAHALPVCLLAEDPGRTLEEALRLVSAGSPALDFEFEDVIIRLWRCADPVWIGEMRERLARQALLLVAGHHMYEGALTYRDMMRLRTRSEVTPFDFIPALVTGMHEDTTILRPVFRVVRVGGALDWDEFLLRLSKYFRLTTLSSMVELAQLPAGSERHVFGIAGKDRLLLARREDSAPLEEIADPALGPEVRELDISILHNFIIGRCLGLDESLQQRIEHVDYVRDIPEAVGAVQRDEGAVAFFMGPLHLDHVRRLMRAGSVVPPSTTTLFPSLPGGVILHRLDEVTR